jgi:PEP-CTERM/exosortase A-associated glycosyltransferase
VVRVLHVLDHSLPEVSGYSIRSHSVLRAQRALGIDATAVAQSSRVMHITEEAIDGVPYVWLPSGSHAGRATVQSSLRRMARLARFLSVAVRQHHIALLHAHTPSLNGIPALWAANRRGVPLIYEMRGLWEATAVYRNLTSAGGLRYRSARTLETWLIRRVTTLAVISQGLHDEALRRGVPADRIVRVPNSVDTSRFQPRPPDSDLIRRCGLAGNIVFGYVGFFFAYEGVDILLRAFAQVAARLPQARLLLVGRGEEDAALRALAAALGIESKVIFAGAVPHEDVQRWYSLCDVLVYPRRTGKLTALVTPLKPLEAMAMGKPVVAAAVGGLQELIRDGDTGLLCEPEDPAALAAALAALAAAPQRRDDIGANARRFVCAERDWTQLARRCESLYARLIAARQGISG